MISISLDVHKTWRIYKGEKIRVRICTSVTVNGRVLIESLEALYGDQIIIDIPLEDMVL